MMWLSPRTSRGLLSGSSRTCPARSHFTVRSSDGTPRFRMEGRQPVANRHHRPAAGTLASAVNTSLTEPGIHERRDTNPFRHRGWQRTGRRAIAAADAANQFPVAERYHTSAAKNVRKRRSMTTHGVERLLSLILSVCLNLQLRVGYENGQRACRRRVV